MAALTALALAAGIGTMAYGAYEQNQGRNEQQAGLQQQQAGYEVQADAARQAAQISKEQAASSVTYAGQERDVNNLAADQSVTAAGISRGINQNIVADQRVIENQKRQAMEVDARRQQLEIIRNQQRTRALGLTNAVGQGASKGSGLQGGYGQTQGQTGVNLLGVQQSLQTGENIFAANSRISSSNSYMADLNYYYTAQQAANQTAKSNIAYNYAQVNAGYQTRQADVQTLNAEGAGQVARGGGTAQAGASQVAMGQSLFNAGPSIFSMGTNFDKLSGSNFGTTTGYTPGFQPSPLMQWLS